MTVQQRFNTDSTSKNGGTTENQQEHESDFQSITIAAEIRKRSEEKGDSNQQVTYIWQWRQQNRDWEKWRSSRRKDARGRDENLRVMKEARGMEGDENNGGSMLRRVWRGEGDERGREWNGKVTGEVGNEVYLIWVNLKPKWGKGNHWNWEPNNIKGNGVFPFPFPFLKTPNQTPP